MYDCDCFTGRVLVSVYRWSFTYNDVTVLREDFVHVAEELKSVAGSHKTGLGKCKIPSI